MTAPIHSTLPIGGALSPDYFHPGTTTMNGREVGSLWAIAYYGGMEYRYERIALGLSWTRIS